MSFLTLHYTSHLLCHVDIHRHLYKTRLNPVLAIAPSSVLLHTNESEKFPESKKGSGSSTPYRSVDFAGSVVSQVNTVGIIGGVSVDSTLNFLRKLVKWSSKDGESCVPFVLCSDPVLNKEVFSHERSSFPYLSCKSDCTQLDPTPIVKSLQSKGAFLENSGARCIVMPCNVLHSWHDEVSKGCSVPFLHMGESVARELKEAKLKPPEAGSLLRIGVLATDATLKAGFYQEKLQNEVNFFFSLCLLLFHSSLLCNICWGHVYCILVLGDNSVVNIDWYILGKRSILWTLEYSVDSFIDLLQMMILLVWNQYKL